MDAYLPKPTILINYSFPHNSFPQKLKLFEVIPLCKKLDPLQKENYRPVSLLLHTSKVFERIIHKQITNYMRDKLNKSITGFRKSHGTQHSIVVTLEKWKRRRVTRGGRGGGLPCPFSKIGKKCPNLDKKCLDCDQLWVKCFI